MDIFTEQTKPLCTRKVRQILTIFVLTAGICAICACITTTAKIPALYAFTAATMFFFIIQKNSLNKYEIYIFFLLCVQLFVSMPKQGGGVIVYLLSYRYGVSSRGFIATIIDILTNGAIISENFVWNFIFSSEILLAFLLSLLLGTAIQKSKGEIKHFVLFLSLLYLTCFTAPLTYFIFWARPEIYAYILMLIILTIVEKHVLRFLIPLFALFILSIHIILVFFYIPCIGVLLMYRILKDGGKQKSSIVLLIVTIVVIIVAFLLYILFRGRTFVFQDAHSFAEHLKNRTDFRFDENWIYMYMFATLRDHLDGYKNTMRFDFAGNFSIIINVPFIAGFVIFWIKCIKNEMQKQMKFFFALPIALLFFNAIAFFLFWDFGRWMVMVMNIQFIFIFYLIYRQNAAALRTAQVFVPAVKKHAFLFVLIFILMNTLGPVTVIGPSAGWSRIFHALFMILGLPWTQG